MSGIIKSFEYGGSKVTLETGIVARQASSVLVNVNDTIAMANVVGKKNDDLDRGFFPLTVNYQERGYAGGKIPGGFIKREGRPSERETLTSRLIDRPLRPLFPEGFRNEVQVVVTILSLNPDVRPDIPALIAASAALSISGIPFNGPIGAARVGYINEQYVINPSDAELEQSKLDLVVAGTNEAVLMVESEADMLSEQVMLGAVMHGHEQMQVVIDAINQLSEEVGNPPWDWQPVALSADLIDLVKDKYQDKIAAAYQITQKLERQEAVSALKEEFCAQLDDEQNDDPQVIKDSLKAFEKVSKDIVRNNILQNKQRIDGRDTSTVRPINIDINILKRTHGSALFTRGDTQALVVTTLGTERDAQIIDAIDGESKEPFMLHYNFPPYCVGETGMMSGPKRREIGHGNLAKRAIKAVLPTMDDFPYVIRVVSEITESNGSSSMATVCGSSLALMDAGVPISSAVAGVAMGLIKEGDQFAVLTDIIGDEDHLGDMDFKVAGTPTGITALQMDIKIGGITKAIMEVALDQAKAARLHILEIMAKTIAQSKINISEFAPSIITVKIHPDKIRDIIGKGGATIRALTEETGTSIDISDDGVVKIAAVDKMAGETALQRIKDITADAEIGKTYLGTVVKIVEFGAFVNFLPGKDGLLHISQISEERVKNVHDVLQEGQQLHVKVLDIDRQGRVKLSKKEAELS